VENQAVPLRPRVLLLYPRDCKPFMNMMKTFREMLKQITKCEVRAFVALTRKLVSLKES
jgi:hypothetical protein